MTLRDLETTASKAHLAIIVIRDGRPCYVDLDDATMRTVFGRVVDALEEGERELLAAYGEEVGNP